MIPIKNLNDYTEKMSSAIKDKLFFVDKIYSNVYVDYGCADGTLLQQLDIINNDRNKVYIGYDYSPQMIELAKAKWNGIGKVIFTSDYEQMLSLVNDYKKQSITLILSSVLHEILSQNINQNDFFDTIIPLSVKYIVIRDMAYNPIISNYNLELYNVSNVECKQLKKVEEFKAKFGDINTPINFCHYLLKYPYDQNWDRELEENYFAFNPDMALVYLRQFKYFPIYFERFNVKFISNRIYNDWRIDIEQIGQTHVKIILQKC